MPNVDTGESECALICAAASPYRSATTIRWQSVFLRRLTSELAKRATTSAWDDEGFWALSTGLRVLARGLIGEPVEVLGRVVDIVVPAARRRRVGQHIDVGRLLHTPQQQVGDGPELQGLDGLDDLDGRLLRPYVLCQFVHGVQ
ncbi:hypothetical protein ColKHC_09978 [Colletotrichum higginsianum]|nr:hypothetical protein ColKHC_09978 [Colletotrichum higginsianum]